MAHNDVEVKIAGVAGDGSFATGELLAYTFKRMGLYVVTTKDFPSNIRGLPSNYSIRGSVRPVYGPKDYTDFLIAFDHNSVKLHIQRVAPGGVVLYDTQEGETLPPSLIREDVHYYPVPLRKLAREKVGMEITKNVVALGMLCAFICLEEEPVFEAIAQRFGRKGEKVVQTNIQAYRVGQEYARQVIKDGDGAQLIRQEDPGRLLLMGNEIVGLGAIAAGCRFLAAYPITPASELLEFLSRELPKVGGVAVQAEDEIASINLAIGAAHAGVRAMTSSSGPGIALKTEALSYAGATETPLVIYDAMRVGPSTGLPTKTEQGDILHALFAGHGEFPRIVLIPGPPEEAFYLIGEAFNLAERFQVPVFFLTDQFFAQNKFTLEPDALDPGRIRINRGKLTDAEAAPRNNGMFLRYQMTDDGVSPRILPGTPGGYFGMTGFEHEETGYGTEDEENRVRMMEKRLRKMAAIREAVPKPVLYGDPGSPIGIVSAGSTFGPVTEAMERLQQSGISAAFLRLVTLWPFPEREVRDFVASKERVFVVEQNATGQIRFLVEWAVGDLRERVTGINKYSGHLIRPREIEEVIRAEIPQKVEV